MNPSTRRFAARSGLALIFIAGATPVFAQNGDGQPSKPKKPRTYEVRGYFVAGSEQTASPRTFDAILGTERLLMLGGGAEVVLQKRWILRGQLSQFSDTGTRVFVDDDNTIFDLHIPLDITVRATELSAGYRFYVKPRWGMYAAGGWSQYALTEKSNGETDNASGSGWHVLGGFDVKPRKWALIAAEAQWTRTGDMLEGGAAQELGESKLGGLRISVRLGFAF